MQFASGVLLKGRYRILERLGAGGMGEVYLAHDLEQRQPVAIKYMHRELESGESELFRRRFTEEVEILRKVNAQGVPAFVDSFDEDDRSYLIMEYIQGHSLEQLLDRTRDKDFGGLRPSLVAEVGIQVCKILEHIHSQDPALIHRDIKPSNIIIRSQDDAVFLVDFGLAREIHSKSSAKTMVGTAAYCPLEQFQGRPEPRSDIYSLGATMYELLTGCQPKPLNIPPIQDVLPNLHEDLVRIINRSVRAQPQERYSAAADMRIMLEEARPRLEQNTPIVAEAKEPTDRVEELIRRWGKGKIAGPLPPHTIPTPKVLESSVLMESVKRAQARARELQERRPGKFGVPVSVTLGMVIVAVLITHYWVAYQERKVQHGLVEEVFAGGGPAPGWKTLEAFGLFPGEGLGMGDSPRGNNPRAGVIFAHEEPQTIKTLRCQVRRLKGWPRILVYAQPNGLLLEPQNNTYQLRLVSIDEATGIDGLKLGKTSSQSKPISLGAFTKVDLRLVMINKSKAHLYIDRRAPIPLNFAGPWVTKSCGVIQFNSVKNYRAAISGFQIQ